MKYKIVEGDTWYVTLSGMHPENKKILDPDELSITSSYYEYGDMSESKHLEHLIAKFKGELEE